MTDLLFDDLDLEPKSEATFSECRKWRYELRRTWDESKPPVVFLMLNPSTADETKNDPTVTRCINHAKRWGYGGVIVLNIFAFRATDPEDMKATDDPIGPENDQYIREWCKAVIQSGSMIVCAWGTNGTHEGRNQDVISILNESDATVKALQITKHGHPWHPLYCGSKKTVTFLPD